MMEKFREFVYNIVLNNSIQKENFMQFILHPLDHLKFGGVSEMGFINLKSSLVLEYHLNKGYEFVYIFSGHFQFELYEKGVLKVPGRNFSITSPGTKHRGFLNVLNKGSLFYMVFDPESKDFSDEMHLTESEKEQIRTSLKKSENLVHSPSSHFCSFMELFRHTCMELDLTNTFDTSTCIHSLRYLCMLLFRELTKTQVSSEHEVITQVLKYIDSHVKEKITIEKIAAVAGYSKSRLYSLFDLYVGQTPNDYLQSSRCASAARMLAESDQSITYIAMEYGFSSSQYFSRVFKKFTGFSPNYYRKGLFPLHDTNGVKLS